MSRWTIRLLCAVSIGAVFLWAQGAATIVGVVSDPSGAAVVGAKVTVGDAAKGFIRVMSSDSAGAYTAAKIPIGHYTVTVEAPRISKGRQYRSRTDSGPDVARRCPDAARLCYCRDKCIR